MARSYGRVFATIWADDDFRAIPVNARLMYVFLLSQPDLDHAGVIPLRIRRWSRALAVDVAEVEKMLSNLDAARFVVIDSDSEELLVRSLIRRDETYKQPNVFKSAASAAAGCESGRIKAALAAEVRRLDLTASSREIQRTRDHLLALLEPFANPSPAPPEPPQEPPVDKFSTGLAGSEPGVSGHFGISAGQKGSGGVREPLAKGTSEPRGKGSSNCPVPETAFPLKPYPLPLPPGPEEPPGGTRPPRLSAVPDATPGEGEDSPGEQNPDFAILVAEVRRLRPGWSTRSIGRALASEDVAERPWPLVRAAMLAVARDPQSRQPGRLAHDGPWWAQSVPLAGAARPDWCGSCDERTRLREDGQERLFRCPECHPHAREAS